MLIESTELAMMIFQEYIKSTLGYKIDNNSIEYIKEIVNWHVSKSI
jgi:hypothetical protein